MACWPRPEAAALAGWRLPSLARSERQHLGPAAPARTWARACSKSSVSFGETLSGSFASGSMNSAFLKAACDCARWPMSPRMMPSCNETAISCSPVRASRRAFWSCSSACSYSSSS